MSFKKIALLSGLVVSGIAVSSVFSSAQAAVLITAQETGGNVLFSYSGTLNLSGYSSSSNGPVGGPGIDPSQALIVFDSGTFSIYSYNSIGGPSSFGSGDGASPSSTTNNQFGIQPGSGDIYVPTGYSSGGSLSGSMTFNSATFASLGITPGSYTWTIPNDSITLTVSTSVPEPLNILGVTASLVLFGTVSTALKKRKVSK